MTTSNNVATNKFHSLIDGLSLILLFAIIFSSAIWFGLLHWYFGVGWVTAFIAILEIFEIQNQYLPVILGLSIALGLTIGSWLYLWLQIQPKTSEADKFKRGSHIVDSKY